MRQARLPVFSRVRRIQFRSVRSVRVVTALVSKGLGRPVIQDRSRSCNSVQISWAEQWQNRARADLDEAARSWGAVLRVADLARQGDPRRQPDKGGRRQPPC